MTATSPLASLIKGRTLYRDSNGDYFYRNSADNVVIVYAWDVLPPTFELARSYDIATLADTNLTVVLTTPIALTQERVGEAIAHEKETAAVFPIME